MVQLDLLIVTGKNQLVNYQLKVTGEFDWTTTS